MFKLMNYSIPINIEVKQIRIKHLQMINKRLQFTKYPNLLQVHHTVIMHSLSVALYVGSSDIQQKIISRTGFEMENFILDTNLTLKKA